MRGMVDRIVGAVVRLGDNVPQEVRLARSDFIECNDIYRATIYAVMRLNWWGPDGNSDR